MPGQITVTFRGFTDPMVAANLPLSVKTKIPNAKRPGPMEETLLRTGLEAAALGSTRVASLLSLIAPPTAMMRIIGAVGSLPIRRTSDFTIAVGYVAQAAAGISAGLGGGVYYWNKRPSGEVGLFGTVSIGAITNIGFGAGDSFAYMFDAAGTVLAGDLIGLEVDVEIGPVTVGGQMFLTAPPVTLWPPTVTGPWVPEVVGVGFQVTAGISVSPVAIAVSPSRTWIRPII
jgi:hypothetical protein